MIISIKNQFIVFMWVGILALSLAACARTAPIYSVSDAPVVVSSVNHNATDVKNAILRAGSSLGWQIREIEPGHIVGTLSIRKHTAEVDIYYNAQTYSIGYRDSNNLNYDGANIHSNYNGWVQNLDNAIKNQLLSV